MSSYAADISHACEELGLGKLKLTPHGLRHSGPSTDSLHRIRDITTIQARGRWKSPSSGARYRKPGRMLLLHQFVPQNLKAETCKAKVIAAFHKIEIVFSLARATSSKLLGFGPILFKEEGLEIKDEDFQELFAHTILRYASHVRFRMTRLGLHI